MNRDLLLERIKTAQDRCQETMLKQMGERGLCQLHKEHQITDELKYWEGQLVALGDLRRAVQRWSEGDFVDIDAVLTAGRDTWQQQLHHYQSQVRPASNWVAYCQGGLTAIEALLQADA